MMTPPAAHRKPARALQAAPTADVAAHKRRADKSSPPTALAAARMIRRPRVPPPPPPPPPLPALAPPAPLLALPGPAPRQRAPRAAAPEGRPSREQWLRLRDRWPQLRRKTFGPPAAVADPVDASGFGGDALAFVDGVEGEGARAGCSVPRPQGPLCRNEPAVPAPSSLGPRPSPAASCPRDAAAARRSDPYLMLVVQGLSPSLSPSDFYRLGSDDGLGWQRLISRGIRRLSSPSPPRAVPDG